MGLEPWVPQTSDQTALWEGPCGRKEVQTGEEEEETRPASQASLSAQGGRESWDVYDRFLTQAEIQGNINHVNGERRGLGMLSG